VSFTTAAHLQGVIGLLCEIAIEAKPKQAISGDSRVHAFKRRSERRTVGPGQRVFGHKTNFPSEADADQHRNGMNTRREDEIKSIHADER
jgi:hypothetical protein